MKEKEAKAQDSDSMCAVDCGAKLMLWGLGRGGATIAFPIRSAAQAVTLYDWNAQLLPEHDKTVPFGNIKQLAM